MQQHPEIETVLDNILSSHYGLKLFGVLSMLGEAFARDGVTQSDLSDSEFIKWVNSKLGDGRADNSVTDYASIGLNSGSEPIVENDDPFASLRPEQSF